MTRDIDRIPYLKINKLVWKWKLCEGQDGGIPVCDVGLSMAMAPPGKELPVEQSAPVVRAGKRDSLDKMVDDIERIANAFSRFRKWLDTPVQPDQPKAEGSKKEVPPFDIQQIPDAMRKEHMPISARLMERWFSGELNYSVTLEDQRKEINQKGELYSESMIDRTTIKMDWVLRHARAKRQYDRLVNFDIYGSRAYETLKDILGRYRSRGDLSPWTVSDYDIRKLHREFQFQRAAVESSFEQKALQAARRLPDAGVPDDLTGALGAFNFYAAVAGVTFDVGNRKATVTHIVVYVRDGYSFEGVTDSRSQYLGHWSKNGVVIVPSYVAANLADQPWFDFPVVVGSTIANLYEPGKVYYPVRNRSFREWQTRHRQGGDFIIFSDYRPIMLNKPITVYFE
ncbi:DUF6402 family protein [Burkholderia multivorans]|uniref:DUF6402 family protein n=1 Tax=Burkholderia multivorans TaxID=87883 RepID=UPI0020B21F8E|nr:DUF6402 family protein [Burkholderia multivorans]MDN7862026.1 DUF6402 family protein [Burkholderia multivorans]